MFIVIDGPDGSGKTTLAKGLAKRLREGGRRAVYTSEPTCHSEAGRAIRRMLKSGRAIDPYEFADLFVIDRREHLANFIQPHLDAGDWVICDRYKYSALAYQQLQGVDAQYLIDGNRDCLIPDVIFLLIPHNTDLLLERILQRGEKLELFEKKELLDAALCRYREMLVYFPEENLKYLDAGWSIEENLHQIEAMLK